MKITSLKGQWIIFFSVALFFLPCATAHGTDYVVLAGQGIQSDPGWKKVVERLVNLHWAEVVDYHKYPSEALGRLRELYPRYVAVVEKPERIDRQFVMDINRMSRQVDDDIYGDFLWGIITGYDAEAALQLTERAQAPEVVGCAWCLRNQDFRDGKYFERMGLTDKEGHWYEKDETADSVVCTPYAGSPGQTVERMLDWVKDNDPGLIVYQVEGIRNQLPLFQSVTGEKTGIAESRGGKLWLGKEPLNLGKHPRIFTTLGRVHTFGARESIPIALMNSAQVTALLGPVAYTFHGRGKWGTLKYWLTDAGRFTLAEAHFLNQQDMLDQLRQWDPRLLEMQCPYEDDPIRTIRTCYSFYSEFEKKEKENPEQTGDIMNKFGYLYERDIWAYYGDPLWDVRAKDLSHDRPYEVSSRMKGKKCFVTIRTSPDFSWERLCGELCESYDSFKDIHCAVGNLPLCYFFPRRLKNPRLAPRQKQELEVTVNKDFLFVRNAYLEPGKTYRIVLETDE